MSHFLSQGPSLVLKCEMSADINFEYPLRNFGQGTLIAPSRQTRRVPKHSKIYKKTNMALCDTPTRRLHGCDIVDNEPGTMWLTSSNNSAFFVSQVVIHLFMITFGLSSFDMNWRMLANVLASSDRHLKRSFVRVLCKDLVATGAEYSHVNECCFCPHTKIVFVKTAYVCMHGSVERIWSPSCRMFSGPRRRCRTSHRMWWYQC